MTELVLILSGLLATAGFLPALRVVLGTLECEELTDSTTSTTVTVTSSPSPSLNSISSTSSLINCHDFKLPPTLRSIVAATTAVLFIAVTHRRLIRIGADASEIAKSLHREPGMFTSRPYCGWPVFLMWIKVLITLVLVA